MKLTDFFSPLNLYTLSIYFCLFAFFDILGTFIKKIFIKKTYTKQNTDESRIINWLIGLGGFIFIWFILSLVVPYTKINLLISIGILLFITAPNYFKNKGHINLVTELWSLRLPLLIVTPLLPAVFVKASLPPYYSDEMAYHFASPYTILNLSPIKYVGGLYADIPRLMNMFYDIVFSLTKTYSIARLFHFTILATSMLYTFKVLKVNFSLFVGFLFVFMFFSLPQDIVLTSTLGYIDVAAYSFALIAIVSFVWFIKSPSVEPMLLMFIFWAMNLGTKYTGVSTFFVFTVLFSFVSVYLMEKVRPLLNRKNLSLMLTALLLFGGYWYVKNFIWFGNPIFPFIFNCWGVHVEPCPQLGGFFGNWTTKINIENSYLILSQLLLKNRVIHIVAILTPLFALFIKDKKIKVISILMMLSVLFELLILKYFSGFYVRYQQHMQLYILLAMAITFTTGYKSKFLSALSKVIILLLLLSSSFYYLYVVFNTNSLKFLNWNEINYSLGKMDINQWVDHHFPKMKNTIHWCEDYNGGKSKLIARYDPDLIWFDYDGLNRAFIINCDYSNPISNDISTDKIIDYAKSNRLKFYLMSSNRCIDSKNIAPKFVYEADYQNKLRNINNVLVCNSKEVEPYLYYFDYEKLP